MIQIQYCQRKKDTAFKLKSVNWLNHDTNVYVFQIPDKKKLDIPLGHHICIFMQIDGNTVKRQYTPIVDKPGAFELMVKTYKTYGVSEHLASMSVGDPIQVRGPFGHFLFDRNKKYSRVCMYAAGSGITPHFQILSDAAKNNSTIKFVLLFCNKDVKDILFKMKLDQWAKTSSPQLEVTYFLTRAKGEWKGEHGRVTKDAIARVVSPKTSDSRELHLICGPDGYRDSIYESLVSLEIPIERIVKF